MNFNHENSMWDWQSEDHCFEDTTNSDAPEHHLKAVKQIEEHLSFTLDGKTTPVKDCGDSTYHVIGNEAKGKEAESSAPSSQAKRRRMLNFGNEAMNAPLYDDCAFLRSKETHDSLEDALSDMSQWVAGFQEGTSGSSIECLDPSSDGWIADYLNDSDIQYVPEDIESGTSDVQISIADPWCVTAELCNTPENGASLVKNHPVHTCKNGASLVKNHPVHTCKNGAFRGRKSVMRASPGPFSSVVYPFAFIKPCGARGDVTLKDINQRLHTPPKLKQNEDDDPSVCYPTSAFSGKPVVGKTKIRTEGGEGSITIMRTKG